jgi:hypothetical protein
MKKTLKSVALSALCVVAGISIVHSARKPVPEHQMIAKAERIVVGTVSSSKSYWDDNRQRIWTDYVIAIQATIKGDSAQSTCTVTVMGGEVGDVGLIVSEEPRLAQGEQFLIYLSPARDKRTRALHGRAGALKIVNGLVESTSESMSSVQSRISRIVAQTQ